MCLVSIEITTSPAPGQLEARSVAPGPAAVKTALQSGLPLTGTLTRRAIPTKNREQFALGPPEVEKIEGNYFPGISVVRFRINPTRTGGALALAVLNPEATRMAVIYTGTVQNNLPFVLAVGDKFPAETSNLLPDSLAGLKQREQQAAAAQQAMTDYIQKLQALQLEIAAAVQSGNKQRAQVLQQKLLQLNQQMVQQHKQQANQQLESIRRQGANGTPQQQLQALQAEMQQAALAGDKNKIRALQLKHQQLMMSLRSQRQRPAQPTACPEHIVRWVREMDRNGASFQEFRGTAQLSNLFRPILFSSHFGKPFAQLSGAEKSDIAVALHRSCIRQGTDFYTSPNATSIQSVFGNATGFSSADAGIAGIALEMIAKWSKYTLAQIKKKGDFQRVILLEHLYAELLNLVWPDESRADKAQLSTVKDTMAHDEIMKHLNQLIGEMSTQGVNALRQMARLQGDPFYKLLTKGSRGDFDSQLNTAIDRVLPPYLTRSLEAAAVAAADIPTLTRNAAWYRSHADIFAAFAGTTAVKNYQRGLGGQRESVFKTLQQDIEAEIKRINSRAAITAYGNKFLLPLDNTYSPTWRNLEAKRIARIAEIQWEEHVKRVGKGPFGPRHPGAVYLNALYRNDRTTLKQEDARFAEPFRSLARPINQSGMHQMLAMFTGGSFTASDIGRYIDSKLKDMSMADILAGFFIVSYEHVYPKCMTNPVVVQRTVVWDKVARDIFNDDPWDTPDTQTYNYNIKGQHASAFKQVGVGKGPEEMEMISALFGGFFPTDLRASQAALTSVLKGLRMAMQNMACDDPDMQRLEQNLMKTVQSH